MGQEEAEEDGVEGVRGRHGERIDHLVAHVGPLPDLGSVELEHLRRRIGGGQLSGPLGEQAGPLSSACRDLEHASTLDRGGERRTNGLRVSGERVAIGHRGRVVLGRASAVVGDLLLDQAPVIGHRSTALRGDSQGDGRGHGGCRQRERLSGRERRVTGEQRRGGAGD